MNPVTYIFAGILAATVCFYEFKRIPDAATAARNAALLEVHDQQIRDAAARESERQAAQSEISTIEQAYIARQTDDARQIQTLNEAIANAEKFAPGTCAGGLPVELRNAIDPFGRQAITGDHPAIAAPAVRPSSRSPKRSPVERHGGAAMGK